MSIIKLKAKISEKKQTEKLSDEKLSDTVGGLVFTAPKESITNQSSIYVVQRPVAPKSNTPISAGIVAGKLEIKEGKTRDQKLGKLIGYCTDCKCPVYTVTRKNHAGHNVITGAGR